MASAGEGTAGVALATSDDERRFGGLARLYGTDGYARLRGARVAVVGLGGVGSWAAEALGRSGVALLRLIDLDHVSESNINRQVQALGATVGAPKGEALAARLRDIHPGCRLEVIDAFVEPDNVGELLATPLDAVIDACDDGRAKLAMALWCRAQGLPLVICGAAGGKRRPEALELADLSKVTHDPLLARLRQRVRKATGHAAGSTIGVACVFSREPVAVPGGDEACSPDGSLNCHGYGSSVMVTASFGLTAAAWVVEQVVQGRTAALPPQPGPGAASQQETFAPGG